MIALTGVLPIVATPFTPDGGLDLDSFDRLVEVLARGGCHGLTLFGIAGEYYKLSDEERLLLVRRFATACRRLGVPSIISVTDHATVVAADSARRWADLGADALMLLPPFFLKPGAAGIEHHIRAVGAAVPALPVMVQYAPEQTGVAIAPAVFARIAADLANVRDFKVECRPVGRYLTTLIELAAGGVRCHVGNAGYNMIEAMDRGAVGVMPGCSMYDLYLDIHRALVAGDRATALAKHAALLPVLNHIRQDVEMIIRFEKHILMRRGIIAHDHCRLPAHEPDRHEWQLFEELWLAVQPHLRPLC
jgi:2-keto-3-deoxy-L-arabinonate dehydratase